MTSFWDFKGGFTQMGIVLIPVTIAINVGLHFITVFLNLPIYLDTVGTILATILAGPWVGAVSGLITNVVIGLITGPTYIPYSLAQVAIALTAGVFVYYGWYRNFWGALVAGFVINLVGTIISAPITTFVFGGATGVGADVVTTFFLATGKNLFTSVFASSFLTGLVDKVLSSAIAYLIGKAIPSPYLAKFPVQTRKHLAPVA